MEVTGWKTGFGGCVKWPLRMLVYQKTEGFLILFHYTRVKDKGLNIIIIDILIYYAWLEKYIQAS